MTMISRVGGEGILGWSLMEAVLLSFMCQQGSLGGQIAIRVEYVNHFVLPSLFVWGVLLHKGKTFPM